MIIKISSLSDGEHNFEFIEKSENVGLTNPFEGDTRIVLKLRKTHSQVIIDNELSINCGFECDRCGTEFKQNIVTNYQIVYLFGKEPVESDAVNVIYLPVDADKIDLKPEIIDYATLAVPMKKLCREDCKGLCYKCGKNLNAGECGCSENTTDIRWQPLADLKDKLNKK
ncbi:MAG: DUF177 domain-containing protein [Ignavibacteriales bacterium]|nr:MAG: DUF177 domain-containing protein [Ignavibacteriales bacterium]